MKRLLFLIICLALCLSSQTLSAEESEPAPPAADAGAAEKQTPEKEEEPDDARKELLTGTVKFLGPALRNRGIKAYEEMDKQTVLITEEGELVPLVADWRGRAFHQDERLRNRKVQLVVRRRPGIPYAQVLMVYTFDKEGNRKYTDYWCDICSIPMYEIKDCECCQGPIRLRFQDQPLPSYLSQELNASSEKDSTEKKTP